MSYKHINGEKERSMRDRTKGDGDTDYSAFTDWYAEKNIDIHLHAIAVFVFTNRVILSVGSHRGVHLGGMLSDSITVITLVGLDELASHTFQTKSDQTNTKLQTVLVLRSLISTGYG